MHERPRGIFEELKEKNSLDQLSTGETNTLFGANQEGLNLLGNPLIFRPLSTSNRFGDSSLFDAPQI